MSEIRTDTINNASGDNDSGIDLSTNDQVKIKTANTTALTVNASQRVGIGGTPLGYPFEVYGGNGDGIVFRENTNSVVNWFGALNSLGTVGTGSNHSLAFYTNGSERMRVDTSGNLLVGKTSNDSGTASGTIVSAAGVNRFTADGNHPLVLKRLTSDGTIVQFEKDSTIVGSINSSPSVTGIFIGNSNTGLTFYDAGSSILPATTTGLRDNGIDLGNISNRFDDIYATNGTIQTSDRNEKQDIEELSDAEQRVAVVAKGLMRKFRWIDSVAEKGDNARTHFGIIAQDLQDAFTAEGLDASKYAMFTSNTWWEKEISVDAVEADEENGIEAKDAYTYMDTKEEATEGYTEKTRLGVRYNQLLAFIISAL